jgi:hypothetical protein
VSVRVYLPTTLDDLAAHLETGEVPATEEYFLAEGEGEEEEYLALMSAADASAERVAGLVDGRRRRVVVVAEVERPGAAVAFSDVVAVHADESDDAGEDDEPGWYATQEVVHLLAN